MDSFYFALFFKISLQIFSILKLYSEGVQPDKRIKRLSQKKSNRGGYQDSYKKDRHKNHETLPLRPHLFFHHFIGIFVKLSEKGSGRNGSALRSQDRQGGMKKLLQNKSGSRPP